MNQRLYPEITYTYTFTQYKPTKYKKEKITLVTCISISRVLAHSSTYQTAYTDACKTHCALPVYTTVFLKKHSRICSM